MSDIDLTQLAIDRGAPDSSSGPGPMRRRWMSRYLLPGLIVLGFVGLAGWMAWDLVFPPREVTVVPVMVNRAVATTRGQPVFQASGWIEPRPTPIRVAALTPGVIRRLLVVENQEVQAGETVAELVDEDARLALKGAEASLSQRKAEEEVARAALAAAEVKLAKPVHLEAPLRAAEAQLAKVSTQLEALPFQLRQADADVAVAKADHSGKVASRGVVAEIEIERALAVYRSAVASQEQVAKQVETLRVEHEALTRQVAALRVRLELLVDETEARDQADGRLRVATARVAAAGVAVSEARLKLSRMNVAAMTDGRVYQLVGAPGARIGDGMTQMQGHDGSTVVTLYRPEMLQARVDVRFSDLPQVAVGQPVSINNPALATSLTGEVHIISAEADIQKNTLEIKVSIDEPSAVIKPDMLVDITFLASGEAPPSAQAQDRYFVPRALVQTGDGGTHVWLADRRLGRARRVSVTLGVGAPGGLVEIEGGITIGSRIIAGGREGLRDGDRIRVTGEEPEAAYSESPSGGASGGAMAPAGGESMKGH